MGSCENIRLILKSIFRPARSGGLGFVYFLNEGLFSENFTRIFTAFYLEEDKPCVKMFRIYIYWMKCCLIKKDMPIEFPAGWSIPAETLSEYYSAAYSARLLCIGCQLFMPFYSILQKLHTEWLFFSDWQYCL